MEIFDGGNHLPQGSSKSMTRIERAIAIDPSNCDAIRELSVAYLKRGMPDKWKSQMDKAVACNPEIWTGYRGYNYLWFYRDYNKAIKDFNATDSITPTFTESPQGHSVDYWRGIAYLGLKKYDSSLVYFNKYITTETEGNGEDWIEVTTFLYKGIVHFENNEPQKAIESLDKCIQYNSNKTADGKYYKAMALEQLGQTDQARIQIKSALEDFKKGYYNERPYVEEMRQIYLEDLEALNSKLNPE